MAAFLYEFEWDPVKAKENFSKHGVDFERAAQVFRDPLALTIPDEEHSVSESGGLRWDKDTLSNDLGRIRMISARRPTRAEVHAYEEEQ